IRASMGGNRLGSSHSAPCQREFDAKKGAQHCNGVVAPQSSMTPNNVLGHADDPTRYAGVAGINKFPPSPEFLSCRRLDRTGIVVGIATGAFLVTVVTVAGVKCIVWMVLFEIGFECSVLICS